MLNKTSLCAAWLAAIVAANLSIAHWGPQAALYNGFLFLGLDLSTRDALHDMWRDHLIRNMAALIAVGGALSWFLARLLTDPVLNVERIALASLVAFTCAALADTFVYHQLRDNTWYERANQSNIVSAAVDSVLFLTIAGIWSFQLGFGLWCAKVAGGVAWSFVLAKGGDGRAWTRRNRTAHRTA